MYKSFYFLILALILIISGTSCKQTKNSESPSITIENTSDVERKDVLIAIDKEKLLPLLGDDKLESIKMEIPFQLEDYDQDGMADKLLVLKDFTPNEKLVLNDTSLFKASTVSFPKRTQAEISHKINGEWKDREYIGGTFKNVDYLKVPAEHTDHSWYIRYEGPGWESDLVGYRFYLDWRNATDIFGKTTNKMVLQDVGQDGFDSYHEISDWGMDVLKVGNSLGLGSVGTWMGDKVERVAKTDSLECTIISNGIIQSKVETKYHGWTFGDYNTDLTTTLSINAGDRLTKCHIDIVQNIPNICTGIVKLENTNLFKGDPNDGTEWNYLATYGTQTLNNDKLGMVVFFRNQDFIEFNEDNDSHVVVLKAENNVDYYFGAAWEKELNGITDEAAFKDYIMERLDILNNPVIIQ